MAEAPARFSAFPQEKARVRFPMPKRATELAAYQLKKIKTPGLHAVGGVPGLHLQVRNENARSWILRLKVGNRRPDIGLGPYPAVSLERARELASEAREQVRQGIDPRDARRQKQEELKAAQARQLTFAQAALACWKARSQEFRNAKHSAQWLQTLKQYAYPVIGNMQIAAIELAHIVRILEPMWTTKTETASRLRGRIETVFEWAKASGHRDGENPAQWATLRHVLPKPSRVHRVKHYPALPWTQIPDYMARLRLRDGLAARALEFAILTAARSGEVRLAMWDEIDLQAKLWTVPAERMKKDKLHRVPLSDAAVALLEALPRTEGSQYLFPAARGGALSDMALSQVCRRMGDDCVPHGMRSSFKEWCRACKQQVQDEVSELAIAHVSSDKTRAAYARDELLELRRPLMTDWAQYCATLPQTDAVVTPGAQP